MRKFILPSVIAAATLSSGCTESLYATAPSSVQNKAGYVLVAPYFSAVSNRISIAIVPAPPPKDAASPGPPILTIALIPTPTSRSNLFFRKNAAFSSTFNVSVGADGLLTSSDSTSVQQISGILTELAQTAAPFVAPVGPGIPTPPAGPMPPLPSDDRSFCAAAVGQLTSSIALYSTIEAVARTTTSYELGRTLVTGSKADGSPRNETVVLNLDVQFPAGLDTDVNQADVSREQVGFVSYMPVPATVSVSCAVGGGKKLLLSQPSVLSTYFSSRFVDPQRDLLTSPAETFTLTEGFLTGHKYSDQSSVKTVVDTITAPVRALFPVPSVQQTTTFQTGGDKSDQTTTSKQTTTGPPKGS